MTAPTLLSGEDLAETIRTDVLDYLGVLRDHGVTPMLGTVMMSDDAAATRFMDRKHDLCDRHGIATKRVDIAPDAPASECYEAVEQVGSDSDVTALFVQAPLPDHVDITEVRERVPVAKDIDCFNPENVGRLVTGAPRVRPVTPLAVRRLLSEYGISTAGRDVVLVGRNTFIGKPLANMLLEKGPEGDATVTVCHTATTDLAAKTNAADILITAAGVPHLIDASMVSPGTTVVDISVNRVETADGSEVELVGDVDFESVAETVERITPVPGGIGPLTLALILHNIVDVTARQAGVDEARCTD